MGFDSKEGICTAVKKIFMNCEGYVKSTMKSTTCEMTDSVSIGNCILLTSAIQSP